MSDFNLFRLKEIINSITKSFSHFFVICQIEVSILMFARIWPTKRNFESITISYWKLFPQGNLNKWDNYSWCVLSVFLKCKTTIFKWESITIRSHNSWKYLLFFWSIPWTPIHKTIFFPRMAVKITINHNVSLLLHSFDHLFCIIDSWMAFSWRINPLSI